MLGSSKRAPEAASTPLGPPSAEEIRAQNSAEATATSSQWDRWISTRLLPAVDQALRSRRPFSTEFGNFLVGGSKGNALVLEFGGYSGWAPRVFAAFTSRYPDFEITCYYVDDLGGGFRGQRRQKRYRVDLSRDDNDIYTLRATLGSGHVEMSVRARS